MQQQITKDNINSLMAEVLADAKRAGASAAEVDVHIETGFSVTARMGEAETLEHHRDNSIAITVFNGQRSGSVSTSDVRSESLADAVAAAMRIANHTEQDPDSGIADAEQLSNTIPELAINFPWDISPQEMMEMAERCDQLGLDADKNIVNSDGTSVDNHQLLRGYANSHDFNQAYQSTSHSISSVLVAKSGEQMQRDYYYSTARDATDLPSVEKVAELAAARTLQRLNPRPVATAQVPVLFAAEMARSLINNFVGAIYGGAIYKQASFLIDALGKPIFPAWFNLQEQPHLVKGLGSRPFDSNGLLTYDKFFVEQGILKNYALSVYSGRKLKMPSTANSGGVQNLIVTPGELDFDAMLAELGTGFLVTELAGQGVNTVTGDYSRGATGFWVEKGEIQYAVDEATIAGNMADMFKQVRCVGNDVDRRGKVHCGSMIVDGMMIAGSGGG